MRILHHGLDPLLGPTEYKYVATMTWPLQAGSASYRVNVREGVAVASAPSEDGSDAL
jgi:hypothetical protein